MPSFRCAAVIFDLDGVLADSTQAVNRAWEVWAARHGIDALHAIESGHGRTTIETVRELAPHLDARESMEEMEALEESFLDSVVPVPGAPQFVARVNELRIPWAVATSSSARIAQPRLAKCGIPRPAVFVTAADVTRGKPDAQPYERAASGLHVAPANCAVFEDSPNGLLSARRAGAIVIGIAGDSAFYSAQYADATACDFRGVRIDRVAQEALALITVA